jgi:hypothetical protein
MIGATLDKLFSEVIRLTGSDWKGWNHCYTCGVPSYWIYLECGHYVPRANMETRFSIINCKPQCYKCNHTLNGNLEVFRKNLIRDYGIEEVEKLEKLKHSTKKYSRSEIKELENWCKIEIKRLKNIN